MESLSLTEAHVLSELLSDPTGKQALTVFLNNQYEYHATRCTEYMLTDQQEEAKKSAHFALAYQTMLPELRHFIQNQIRGVA